MLGPGWPFYKANNLQVRLKAASQVDTGSKVSLCPWIRAKHLQRNAMRVSLFDGSRHVRIALMRITIDKERVFPVAAAGHYSRSACNDQPLANQHRHNEATWGHGAWTYARPWVAILQSKQSPGTSEGRFPSGYRVKGFVVPVDTSQAPSAKRNACEPL